MFGFYFFGFSSVLTPDSFTHCRPLDTSVASYQAMAGASLYIIGKSLGHKSLASTQVYAHLAVEPIRESMQRGTDKMLGFLNMDTTG